MRTDTEATVELWQEQAIHNLQAAEDFKLELADARREMCELEKQLAAERALADRLADALSKFDYRSAKFMHSTSTDVDGAIAALDAWKEARK